MIRVYKMPNGKKYRFEETDAPAEAVLVEKAKAKPVPQKKAKKPVNKARKAANK